MCATAEAIDDNGHVGIEVTERREEGRFRDTARYRVVLGSEPKRSCEPTATSIQDVDGETGSRKHRPVGVSADRCTLVTVRVKHDSPAVGSLRGLPADRAEMLAQAARQLGETQRTRIVGEKLGQLVLESGRQLGSGTTTGRPRLVQGSSVPSNRRNVCRARSSIPTS